MTNGIQNFFDKQVVCEPFSIMLADRRPLSLTEQLILILIVFTVQKTQKDSKSGYYYINKSFVRTILNQNNQDYFFVRKALEKLTATTIEREIIYDDNSSAQVTTMFFLERFLDVRRRILGFKVNPEIEQQIKNPKTPFAQYRIVLMLILTPKRRAFIFYTIMIQHLSRRTGQQKTEFVIQIDKFRKCLGIKKDKYKIFTDFKKTVLIPLCRYVSKNSDIRVDFQSETSNPHKTKNQRGRKTFDQLRFSIERKTDWKIPEYVDTRDLSKLALEIIRMTKAEEAGILEYLTRIATGDLSSEEEAIIQKITLHNIPETAAMTALEEYGEQGVANILGFVERRFKEGKVKNYGGYLRTCLRKGYGKDNNVTSQSEKCLNKSKKNITPMTSEELKSKFDWHRAKNLLEETGETKRNEWAAEFYEENKQSAGFIPFWNKGGMQNGIVQNLFINYLTRKLPSFSQDEFEKFVSNQGFNSDASRNSIQRVSADR